MATRSASREARPPGESELTLPELAVGVRQFGPQLCDTSAVLAPEQTKDWTCGYECLAALIRTLLPDAAALVLKPAGIRKLREAAQAAGFNTAVQPLDADLWIGAIDMATVLLHLRCDAHIIELIEPVGVGAAVHAAARTLFASGYTRAPIVLQGATHSRTILGVTTSPPRVVLRDSEDETGLLRCVVPADLDGHQYQLVVVRRRRWRPRRRRAR